MKILKSIFVMIKTLLFSAVVVFNLIMLILFIMVSIVSPVAALQWLVFTLAINWILRSKKSKS